MSLSLALSTQDGNRSDTWSLRHKKLLIKVIHILFFDTPYLILYNHVLPKNIEHVWFTCLFLTYLLNIGHIFALCIQYLVPWPKYLGPPSSNIQYLTSPDQKLSKNIYFMGSEWSISLFVLDQGCSIPQLQQPNLGQNCLTKIGARPDKTSNKLLLRPTNLV